MLWNFYLCLSYTETISFSIAKGTDACSFYVRCREEKRIVYSILLVIFFLLALSWMSILSMQIHFIQSSKLATWIWNHIFIIQEKLVQFYDLLLKRKASKWLKMIYCTFLFFHIWGFEIGHVVILYLCKFTLLNIACLRCLEWTFFQCKFALHKVQKVGHMDTCILLFKRSFYGFMFHF